MSSSLSVPQGIADAAATDLVSVTPTDRLNQQKLPWLFPPPGRKLTQQVTDAWFKVRVTSTEDNFRELIHFQDPSNIKKVEERTRRKFKFTEEPQLSLYASYPVVFTNTPSRGSLPPPFPGQYLVIIALGNLHPGNGLPTNVNSKGLSSGQDVLIDGSDAMQFSGKGGGIALFLILDLVKPESEGENVGVEK